MFRTRIVGLLTAAACVMGLCVGVSALEVDCDTTYCFSAEDFAGGEEPLKGICITGLPDPATGTAMLGSRVLRSGDILTAEQLAQITFSPLLTETDQDAVMTYLPIYENRVAKSATMTISIRGKVDQAPVAEDMALETYKNLPNTANLKVTDPEGQAMTYTVTRQPKRGTVTVGEDGSFTYTPKKNKVGVDSFVYTATDPAGNVSREATVTIRILKPTDSTQYTDTVGSECRFAAEWMKNTGLFVGEKVGGECCFHENRTVTRGEFVTMALQVLGIPVDKDVTYTGYTDEVPDWLKPYLAAAMRAGMTANLPASDTFGADEAITGAEAAVMLQNALDLTVSTAAPASAPMEKSDDNPPAWAAAAVAAMSESGIEVSVSEPLTRGQVALILYQVSKLANDAPGLQMYR